MDACLKLGKGLVLGAQLPSQAAEVRWVTRNKKVQTRKLWPRRAKALT